MELAIVADDLSGALEAAVTLRLRTTSIAVFLNKPRSQTEQESPAAPRVVVWDTNSRHLDPTAAEFAVRSILAGLPDARIVIKKIDSLLRGNLSAEILALTQSRDGVVIAAALPAVGRSVVGGIPYVGDRALADTDYWHAEGNSPPKTMAEALAPLDIQLIDLPTVESDGLAQALRRAVTAGRIPVCDGVTDRHLDLIAAAASAAWPRAGLVGTSALAAAVARQMAGDASMTDTAVDQAQSGILMVVGSAAKVISEQVAELQALHPKIVTATPAALLKDTDRARLSAEVERLVAVEPFTLVTITATEGQHSSQSREIAAGLAEVVTVAAHRCAALILTGGETARRVLDRLNVTALTPLGEIHHGAVLARANTGHLIVTRPGSFGGVDSLLRIASHLLSPTTIPTPEESSMSKTPFIAVTMGDGAGVGPEVVIRALLSSEIAAICRPIVVGDAKRLRTAADLLGVDVDVAVVTGVTDAVFAPGRINVIDLNLLPADLPFGELSAVAGDAAFHYIRVASELAMSGAVQAICTAPLNKKALHAGGHIFPGHTELLAALTHTEEVSMMLSTPKVKVIHVTTHIGLIDAIEKIDPPLVERTVRRGHQAMIDAGISNPKIAVCAINPHAGENGLFGRGEEAEKITPAIEVLQADGINAIGPVPADTAFFLAGRGDYDLMVAMYHDQGHGPVKILGLEAGVNITVGLPVIRTSVDHGTAFDIAGKGIADPGSMMEALRQAAQMAPAPAVV